MREAVGTLGIAVRDIDPPDTGQPHCDHFRTPKNSSAPDSNIDSRRPGLASVFSLADASSVICVWTVPLAGLDLRLAWSDLDCLEQERARSYTFDRDRRRFIVARSALRRILGKQLQIAPARLRFELGLAGKPCLRENANLEFNVSHSADVALIAVTRKRAAVGVDIELLRSPSNTCELVDTMCSPAEAEAIKRNEEPNVTFLRVWTRKEAVLKTLGLGVTSISLQKLDVGLDGMLVASVFGKRIVVMPLNVGRDFVASIAQLGSQTPKIVSINATDELWHDRGVGCADMNASVTSGAQSPHVM